MFKRLHLLVLKSFFGPFVMTFFIVLFVLLMQFLWRYIDELVGKGLEIKVIAELILYISASLVPMALPLSILMSSLMTFGNLGEKYELTAMKASGISLQRIMAPMVILVFFISIGTFFFTNNLMPYANLQMRSLLYDIRQQQPEVSIKAGEFYNGISGYSIRINEKNPETNMLYDLKIYDHSADLGNNSVIIADSGTMVITADNRNMILTLYSGHIYTELEDNRRARQKRTYPHQYDTFDEQSLLIELVGFDLERTDQDLFKSHQAMMTLNQLQFMLDSFEVEIKSRQKSMVSTLMNSNYFKKTSGKIIPVPSLPGMKDSLPTPVNRTAHINTDMENPDPNPDSADSVSLQQELQVIDIDSVFNSLGLNSKNRIVSSALGLTRTTKTYINNQMQSLDYKIKNSYKYGVEWHRKFTIAAACLLFLFVGAPLGAIIRKGGLGLPLVLSIVFFLFYYILSLSGEKMSKEGVLPTYQGMWLTSAVFLLAGVFLTYKATTDSSMLNMDTYTNFLKKYFGQKYNIVDKLTSDGAIRLPRNNAKISKINASLTDLDEAVEKFLIDTNKNFRVFPFILTMVNMQLTTDLILLERYYNNTFRTIIGNPIFDNKTIRAKILQFPTLEHNKYQDYRGKLMVKIILVFLFPITILVAIRHGIKLAVLRSRLKLIKSLICELQSIIRNEES